MKKSLRVLQEIKKYLTIFTPILLLVGGFLYLVQELTNGLTHTALRLITSFGFGVLAFMAVNIIYLIIYMVASKKDGQAYEQKTICNNGFINKIYNFLLKYEKIIGLVLSGVCLVLSIILVSLFAGKGATQYWNVYYYLNLLQWGLVVYAMFSILVSKDRKSLIINSILTTLLLAITIWMTINSHTMMHGAIGAYTNMVEHNILVIVFSLLLFLPFGFISTHGSFADFKASTNLGLGFMGLFVGVFTYSMKGIVKKLLDTHIVPGQEASVYPYLEIGHRVAYILLGVVLALCLANMFLNFKKFIKTRNWLGMIDLLCSVVGAIICVIGMFNFTQFLLYVNY